MEHLIIKIIWGKKQTTKKQKKRTFYFKLASLVCFDFVLFENEIKEKRLL